MKPQYVLYGHTFADTRRVVRALTHRSYAHEHGGAAHNERLEFLGDAVLNSCTATLLYTRFPKATEGQLSRVRASLVSTSSLAAIARAEGLPGLLRLGKGEEQTGGRDKDRVLAGAVEAVLGALFLEGGFDAARTVVEGWMGPKIAANDGGWKDPRSQLQELTQARWKQTPDYDVVAQEGPPHDPVFTVAARLGERELGTGVGKSKRDAIKAAASAALAELT